MNIVQIGDKLINKRLRSEIPRFNCALVIGQKRTGKSTLFVPIAKFYRSIGYKVFCNFPMEGCYSIPLVSKYDKKTGMTFDVVDKNWLYKTDLRYCCVLIDEAEQVWSNRDFASWNMGDQKWFTQLGKRHTVVCLITQYFDIIDLNCRRSCDCQIFLTRHPLFENISYCDFSELASLPIIDKTEVVQIKGAKGFYHETWDVCAKHYCSCRMYRKPFYGLFDTEFTTDTYDDLNYKGYIYWNDILNFDDISNSWLVRMFDDVWAHLLAIRSE